MDGLTPKKKYKFRVKAVNKEGESEPLENDEPILARNPYGESNSFLYTCFIFQQRKQLKGEKSPPSTVPMKENRIKWPEEGSI